MKKPPINPLHIEPHPYSLLHPMLSDGEFKELLEDIRADGLIEPIVVYEGKILDGRNRLKACLQLKVKPDFVGFEGDDEKAMKFVTTRNRPGRRLTRDQIALHEAKARALFNERNPKKAISQIKAAEQAGISRDAMQKADKVLTVPAVAAKVEAGEMSLNEAAAGIQATDQVDATPKQDKKRKAKVSPEKLDAALDRIATICGKNVAKNIREGVLTNVNDKQAIFWADLKDSEMAQIQELVVTKRWIPKKAHDFLNRQPGEKTPIRDLISLAIADDSRTLVVVNGWATITLHVRKLADEYGKIRRMLKLD